MNIENKIDRIRSKKPNLSFSMITRFCMNCKTAKPVLDGKHAKANKKIQFICKDCCLKTNPTNNQPK